MSNWLAVLIDVHVGLDESFASVFLVPARRQAVRGLLATRCARTQRNATTVAHRRVGPVLDTGRMQPCLHPWTIHCEADYRKTLGTGASEKLRCLPLFAATRGCTWQQSQGHGE